MTLEVGDMFTFNNTRYIVTEVIAQPILRPLKPFESIYNIPNICLGTIMTPDGALLPIENQYLLYNVLQPLDVWE